VDAGQRQRLRAAITVNGDRLAGLEERFARLEAFVFGNADPDGLAERLDAVAGELAEVRHRLALTEQRVGLATRKPRFSHTRRLAAVALRRRGYSLRAIEVMLGASRNTVTRDLAEAHVSLPPPDAPLGLDSKMLGKRASNGRPPGGATSCS
jgi:hypothetical protein